MSRRDRAPARLPGLIPTTAEQLALLLGASITVRELARKGAANDAGDESACPFGATTQGPCHCSTCEPSAPSAPVEAVSPAVDGLCPGCGSWIGASAKHHVARDVDGRRDGCGWIASTEGASR